MASATLRTCFAALALCLAVAKSGGASVGEDVDEFELPQGLLFGAGVSAVQTEGAWNLSGKVESVADRLLHSEQLHALMQFKGSHDVAANSYHRYKDDVAKAKELKLQLYRFSISWARLLPTTNPAEVNEEGRKYYHDLIQEIKKNGMTPMVTLYHFDHPQSLQDEFLGWESDKMIDKFATYADYVFKEYGDEVKLWTTINEPNQYCMYFNMLFALSGLVKESDMNIHRCMHNSILAHAKVYRQYQRKYYPSQQGQVGFTALLIHAEPMSTSQQDIYAADAFNQLHCGQVLHPVVFGDYPNIVKKLLPSKEFIPFTEAEKADLEGSTDFIGLNVYDGLKAEYSSTASDSRQNVPPMYTQLLESLQFVKFDKDESQLLQFDKISPDIMTRSLVWTWTQYGVPIIITENGFSGAGLQDHDRAAYYSVNLRTLVTTIRSYGVKVLAYCAWSLIDAFEWSAGYSRPFGLIYVDYDKGTLDRSLKQSAEFFISLADSRKVPYVAPSSASTTVAPLVALVLPFLLLKISSP